MAPANIILYEHEKVEFNWTERDAHAVNRLAHASGVEILQRFSELGVRKVRATQYAGIVQLRNHTVQILPKLYRTDSEVLL